ncbi:hypothetical protein L1887_44284 [Cichorium endivia]|nr:hypothetical protein L1887_44284 [Cichorium endivia]
MALIESLFIFTTCFNLGTVSSLYKINSFFPLFNSNKSTMNMADENNQSPPPSLLRFAYLVSRSKGDLNKLWRTLQALYHPWNYYVLHLDLESPPEERTDLASRVENDPIFSTIGNVYENTSSTVVAVSCTCV